MLWIKTGNKWLDGKVIELMNFHDELKSFACINSPLTTDEVESKLLSKSADAMYIDESWAACESTK